MFTCSLGALKLAQFVEEKHNILDQMICTDIFRKQINLNSTAVYLLIFKSKINTKINSYNTKKRNQSSDVLI